MPATPSEASTNPGEAGSIAERFSEEEEEGMENKENEDYDFMRSQFPAAQTRFSPNAFAQPPEICLSPPSPPPLGISPSHPVPRPLSPIGTITLPRRTMDFKQRVRQRRKARDQKRRQRRKGEAEEAVMAGAGVVNIGAGCSNFHIGPITMNVTRQ